MRHLTESRPKPLIEVGGRKLIDHALQATKLDQISNIVINTHYFADQIQAYPYDRPVRFSNEDKLLETGGGLKRALPLLDSEIVMTLNSDAVWVGPNAGDFILSKWRPEMSALLLLVPKQNAVAHLGSGDFDQDGQGRLTRGSSHVYTGMQITRTEPYAREPSEKFSSNLVWSDLIARGGLYGAIYPGQWCDVGYPEAIPLAEKLLDGSIGSHD